MNNNHNIIEIICELMVSLIEINEWLSLLGTDSEGEARDPPLSEPTMGRNSLKWLNVEGYGYAMLKDNISQMLLTTF